MCLITSSWLVGAERVGPLNDDCARSTSSEWPQASAPTHPPVESCSRIHSFIHPRKSAFGFAVASKWLSSACWFHGAEWIMTCFVGHPGQTHGREARTAHMLPVQCASCSRRLLAPHTPGRTAGDPTGSLWHLRMQTWNHLAQDGVDRMEQCASCWLLAIANVAGVDDAARMAGEDAVT